MRSVSPGRRYRLRAFRTSTGVRGVVTNHVESNSCHQGPSSLIPLGQSSVGLRHPVEEVIADQQRVHAGIAPYFGGGCWPYAAVRSGRSAYGRLWWGGGAQASQTGPFSPSSHLFRTPSPLGAASINSGWEAPRVCGCLRLTSTDGRARSPNRARPSSDQLDQDARSEQLATWTLLLTVEPI
jgi:hypothetical protein